MLPLHNSAMLSVLLLNGLYFSILKMVCQAFFENNLIFLCQIRFFISIILVIIGDNAPFTPSSIKKFAIANPQKSAKL